MSDRDEFLSAVTACDPHPEGVIPVVAIILKGQSLLGASRSDVFAWLSRKRLHIRTQYHFCNLPKVILYVEKEYVLLALTVLNAARFSGCPVTAKLFEGVTP